MSAGTAGGRGGDGQREPVIVTVTLPAELVDQLKEFCREYRVTAEIVVERALVGSAAAAVGVS